ncbi:MAG: Senescence marker protein-30 [Acidimicrobiaceae bacterium]|nr:Senescence marker protein-30 [Acidimicrobiaceae bacterium]
METLHAEVALEVGAEIGEGPVWDDRNQELLFVDILGQAVHGYTPATGAHRSFPVGTPVGAVVLRQDGGLVLAAHDRFLLGDADGSHLTPIGDFRADGEVVRFNDGKVDPFGRFVAGTMHWKESEALGALYSLSPNGEVVTVLEGVRVSNGLAWSADLSTFFYIDSGGHTVDAFDRDADSGALSNRRAVTEISGGSPDGMAIDDEGMLWVAVWGGHRVDRIDPESGERVATIEVDASQVASVSFGGPGLDELYIVTARTGLDEAARASQPHAGDLFVAHPGVSGPLPWRFGAPATA